MSISEQVGFLDDAIKGHVKVQLMEKDNIVHEVEADNFVGGATYNWLLALIASTFEDFATESAGGATAIVPSLCPIVRFALTDNASSVPSTARTLPGNEIGYTLRKPYSGADALRGSVNAGESGYAQNARKYRIVIDFATHAGNGTFQTLGFVRAVRNTDIKAPLWKSVVSSHSACVGNVIYFAEANVLNWIDMTDMSGGSLPVDIGTYHYIAATGTEAFLVSKSGNTATIYSLDLTSGNVVLRGTISGPTGWNNYSGGVAADGANIYLYSKRNGNYPVYFQAYDNTTLSSIKSESIDAESLPDYTSFFRPVAAYHVGEKLYLHEYNGAKLCLSDWASTGNFGLVNDESFSPANTTYAIGVDANGEKYGCVNLGYSCVSGSASDGTGVDVNQQTYLKLSTIENHTLGTCVVLPTPVTKTNEQTMKITYELTFNFK